MVNPDLKEWIAIAQKMGENARYGLAKALWSEAMAEVQPDGRTMAEHMYSDAGEFCFGAGTGNGVPGCECKLIYERLKKREREKGLAQH
jgi:hypothetical protein